jgi:protease I
MAHLKDKRVALLATSGFEQSELAEPLRNLKDAGATVHIVALEPGTIRGWNHGEWADEFDVDRTVDAVGVDDYDALVLPGGVINPDKLRRSDDAVALVRDFARSGKPVAAICHGPWMLIQADVVNGRRMTSFFSIRKDMENAGADWVDEEVVVDGNLITSRNPDDIPAFNEAIRDALGERVVA